MFYGFRQFCGRVMVVEGDENGAHSRGRKEDRNILFAVAGNDAYTITRRYTK